MIKKTILLSIAILMAFASFSQEKKNLWSTKLGLGAYYYTGNTNKFDIASDFQLTRKDSLIESNLFIKGAYGVLKTEDENGVVSNEPNKKEFKAGIKFDYKPKSVFSPFVLFSLYNNEFKDIELRISSFVGAKYLFYSSEISSYSISAALEYDIEKYYSKEDKAGKFRLSFRPKFKQKIGENIDFLAIVFYQPNLEDFKGDYLLEGNFSLSTKLMKNLALKMNYHFDYEKIFDDTDNLDGIEPLNTSFITSLVLNF